MFNLLQEMNWLAIVITSFIFSLLGGLWFTLFFGKAYAYSLGRNYNPKEKPKPIFIVGPFFCGLITAVTISIFSYIIKIDSISQALILGSIIGIGFLFSTTLNTAINPNIPKPILYGIISGTYFLISSIIGCSIIYLMK